MKVLIQNVSNGEYLTQNGTWSPLPSHGKDFRDSSCAHALLRRERISDMRVLFYFEDLDYSIRAARYSMGRATPEIFATGVDF